MSFQTLEAVATRQRVVRVDLLPPEIAQARRSKRLRAGLAGSLAVVAVAAGAAYAISAGHVADAESALAAEQARTPALQAAQRPYAEVPQVYAQLRQVQQVQDSVTANDVAWYRFVDGIAAGAPADTALTTVSFALADAAQASGAEGDPLAVPGIGTLSVSGQTTSQAQVATWMESLTRTAGLVDPRLSNSSYDPQTGLVTFTTSATVTADALSHQQ
ncbi:PilN domain-containing protein [Kineococcus sp. SYSU DK001]|uniref:PilN domain-containing protein n=1 Tax=Kineococcus sp. SYSU DK001 TaxID=3383122 RepID=UPI003D7E5FBD